MAANQEKSTSVNIPGIDRLRDVHVAAVNAGDASGWAACFAGDGVQMPPNFSANAGKAAIEDWTKGFMGLFSCQFKLSVDEVQITGNWAFERGRYDIRLTPRSGSGPMDDNGKYITIYQRQPDGDWKIARDIWNSDRPVPGTK